MNEARDTKIKRLKMRSMRRGIKEMDLILGKFADEELAGLTPDQLDAHEVIMAENDQDLYRWISGQVDVPQEIAPAIERVKTHFASQFSKKS